MIDILIAMPSEIIDYATKWLNDKGRKIENGEKVPRTKSNYRPKIGLAKKGN